MGAYASQEGAGDDETAFVQTGSMSMLEQMEKLLDRKLCGSRGGEWNTVTQQCDAFMRATSTSTVYDPKQIFGRCEREFGAAYIPCNACAADGGRITLFGCFE